MYQRLSVFLLLFLFTACLPATATTVEFATRIPTRIMLPTASPSLPHQDWNGTTKLMIANRQGAWLRIEPSHLSLDEVIELPAETVVRVIGTPTYEADPGQWWWLVSSEAGDIGWVEETSLALITPQR